MAVNYAGTISVTNGSAVVTGTGTEWTTLTVASDYILVTADGTICKVSALASSTELTLTKNYAGATASNVEYEIFPTIGADVELGLLVKAFIDDARDIIDGGTALLTALQAAYDTWIADRQAEFDAAQAQRTTDFTAAQDARASQFATDRAQQDLDIANAMNGLEGAPIAKAIPSTAVDICEIKGASIFDLNGGWTQDLSKSWAKEDRVTTTYLGVHNTTASAWTVPGAAAGDWYWDGTNRNIYTLVGTAGATLSTLNRFGAAHFDARFAVAYSDRVILVDGDGVPWMAFESNNAPGADMATATTTISSVCFVGSQLVIGTAQGGWGMSVVDFAADAGDMYFLGTKQKYNGDVSQRNDGLGYYQIAAVGLVNATVNAVAATVLPNAPADPVTGLPVSTILAFTEGGVTQIGWDGQTEAVWNLTHTDSSATYSGAIYGDGTFGYNAAGFFHRRPLMTEDVSGNVRYVRSTDDIAFIPAFDSAAYTGSTAHHAPGGGASGVQVGEHHTIVNSKGLTIYHPNPADPLSGLYSNHTPDYATPMMLNGVKTALFCERGAASLVGVSELDEDFSGYADNAALHAAWTRRNPTDTLLTLSSGAVRIENNAATPEWASRQFNTVVGQTYFVTGQRVGAGAGVAPRILVGPGNYNGSLLQLQFNADGILSGCFTATGATTYLTLATNNGNAGAFAIFDNVSVKLATPDRSVNNKGAVVHGTLSRDADGWISGFSNNNYIEQPYNSDLDFGTGDFYAIVEVIQSTQAASQVLLSKAIPDGSNVFSMFTSAGTGHLGFYHPSAGSVSSGVIVPLNRSVQIGLVRQGGVVSFFIEGSIVHQTTPASFDLTAVGDDRLRIGRDFSVNSAAGTAIRGVAIGAGAPSASQIRVMANWKGDVIEGTIHDTSYVDSTQGLWVLTSSYLYEISPDGAERSKQVNDIGATTLTAFHGGRLVS